MKRYSLLIVILFFVTAVNGQQGKLPVIQQTQFKKDTFNILQFGAVADGISLNTKAINNAILACNKKGGGVVVIPGGVWLTGPVEIKSNVNLHLQKNALLQFTSDHSQYALIKSNWEGLPQMRNQSPIWATNQINIAITGSGIIDGAGESWRMVKKDKLTDSEWKRLVASGGELSDDKKIWYPSRSSQKGASLKNPGVISNDKSMGYYEEVKDFLRPNLLVFTNCKKILLEGVIFQNSPAWCLHPLMSEDITISNISVKNPWYAQNGDGLDLESCSNVLVENSVFDVGDDGICIKSGRDAEGRKRNMPTKNVIVKNCVVYHAHGGFVIGSEMSGGANNIWVDDCTFIGTDIGLRFKTTRGRGGIVENIFINNINMKDIVGEAILFDMYYAAQDPIALAGEKREPPKVEVLPVTEETPQFRNIYLKNIVANGAAKAIFVRGLPEMHVTNIVIKNMVLQAKEGLDMTEGSNILLQHVHLLTANTDPVLNIHNSKNITLDKITYSPNTKLLLNISGDKSKEISLLNTNTSGVVKDVTYTYGAHHPVKRVPAKLLPLSQQVAQTVMNIWKDSFTLDDKPAKWAYDQGVILKGFEGIWMNTADAAYFDYIKKSMDFFITEEGNIKTYKQSDYNIDNVNNGKLLLLLYRVTGNQKYLSAAKLLREQLTNQPRTKEGGFWHKKIYPYQMWLDGLYMGQPFYAEYAMLAGDKEAFVDIANQFSWMEKHARDASSGLLYHGWDESKEQQWASKSTGTSPHFWGRAMGWYAMALVDVLDYFPANHPKRNELIAILNRLTNAVEKVQDNNTGMWWDVLNMPGKKGNYLETSASSMLVYAIAKGVRKGYLSANKITVAKRGYEGIVKKYIKVEDGQTNLYGTVKVSGLGGNPYRDGSYEYYVGEPVIVNDPKGIGAFLLASNEIEMIPTLHIGKRISVIMDNYFNRETKKDAFGNTMVFHYKWHEKDNGGFSFVAHAFNKYGVHTSLLDEGPSASNLKNTSVYFLVDPDWPKENKTPNYILPEHIDALVNWVKGGGVLVMMANDSNNVEFTHFNELAVKFGIQFNENLRHDVINDHFPDGEILFTAGHPIFKNAKKAYIKQLSTLEIKKPAESVYSEKEEVIMAVSRLGKGTVFAVGDPWFYNEYVDGRKLPTEYNNYQAAEDLVKWLIQQVNKK